ncbi:TetR/AcrR family transcriptional regulator [Nocardia mexicana]|uniref:TetR family transcriptional regulator n=1 Tax=Nocardia mexicana TaxID=279262 RepID=A0A370GZB3_9NOCA|nr:TetR/AcrR family transcriptional regulator [Nocardia mexicana]RDI48981.1 TetR family transcriptional regulator [Nocardia mexicana]
MTSQAPRSYGGISAADRRADRRARLVAAARAAWGESGIAAVTVRGVCKSAGLTDRYFYEHFANREDLLAAVADEVRDQLLATLVQAGVSSTGPAEHRLHAALQAFLETVANDRHIHRIVASDPGDIPALRQRRHDVLTLIADLVVDHAPPALAITPDPARLRRAALFITGGVNQLIERWLDDPETMTAAELAAECAHMCIGVLGNT